MSNRIHDGVLERSSQQSDPREEFFRGSTDFFGRLASTTSGASVAYPARHARDAQSATEGSVQPSGTERPLWNTNDNRREMSHRPPAASMPLSTSGCLPNISVIR